MRKFVFLILFLLSCQQLSAHSGKPYDSTYIHVFKQNYRIVGSIYTKKINFSLNPSMHIDSIDKRNVQYEPNVGYYLGVSLSYKMIAMSLSFAIPQSKGNDSLNGKTTFQDLSVSVNTRKFGGTAFIKDYKGFYLHNPTLFDTSWKGGIVPHRDDMEFKTIGVNAYYLFNNKKFSMKSVLSQAERQRRTSSTFLASVNAKYSLIHSDSSMIPLSDEQYYQEMKGLLSMKFYAVSLMGGYAHCNVINSHYYICPMIFTGPGIMREMISSDAGDFTTENLFLKLDLKFAAGYNAKTAFLGVLFDSESDFMPAKFVNFKTTVFSARFFVGYRFW